MLRSIRCHTDLRGLIEAERIGWLFEQTRIDFSLAGGALPASAASPVPRSAGVVDKVAASAAAEGFASMACLAFSGGSSGVDPARA
jgi:hypothetical protein